MAGALDLTMPADLKLADYPAWSTLCAGKVYLMKFSAQQDVVLRFVGKTPLSYPLIINGGRNVRIIGLDIALKTQPGCGVGQLNNGPLPNGGTAPNIHPRVPGAAALNVAQAETTYIEGAHIDVTGHEADCIVVRSPDGHEPRVARDKRHVVLQNSLCEGNEGLGDSPIGNDGVHGDLIQNQGVDVLSTMSLENVSHRTAQEGIVLQGANGLRGARVLLVRRFDYGYDRRYYGDDPYDHQWGGAIAASADACVFEDVFLDAYPNGSTPLVEWNDVYYGPRADGQIRQMAGLHRGPAQAPFAPRHRVGINYRSPHE